MGLAVLGQRSPSHATDMVEDAVVGGSDEAVRSPFSQAAKEGLIRIKNETESGKRKEIKPMEKSNWETPGGYIRMRRWSYS